jgi:hypothetical protein
MKTAHVLMTHEAFEDFLGFSNLGLIITSVSLQNGPLGWTVHMDVAGSGLPEECKENPDLQIQLAYYKDCVEVVDGQQTSFLGGEIKSLENGYVLVTQPPQIYRTTPYKPNE